MSATAGLGPAALELLLPRRILDRLFPLIPACCWASPGCGLARPAAAGRPDLPGVNLRPGPQPQPDPLEPPVG